MWKVILQGRRKRPNSVMLMWKTWQRTEEKAIVGKKVSNWKAAEQLQELTFSPRWEKALKFTGLKAVEQVLELFPYYDEERVVSTA